MPSQVIKTESKPRERTSFPNTKKALSKWVARCTEAILPRATVDRIRTQREWQRWVDSITPDTLADLSAAPLEARQRVFRAHVRRVEIETHAKCNRICSFCPNVIVDRRLNQTVMDHGILKRIFSELGAIDYSGQIVVARYSEPLTNLPYLYECIAEARASVPHAELCITTNTDYLTRPVLDRLQALGLNTIYMSLYLRDRERWSIELARTYMGRLQKKLGIQEMSRTESSTNLLATGEYEGMSLRANCHDWERYGTDRGGSLDQYKTKSRTGPCRDPFETFVVDYTGAVMPCCAMRSDLPEHHNLIAGDLTAEGSSIFDIYAGRLAGWRQSMAAFGRKEFPCSTCNHRELPAALEPAISSRLARRLEGVRADRRQHPPLRPLVPAGPQNPSSGSDRLYTIEAGPLANHNEKS